MNILYLETVRDTDGSGGVRISNRNKETLKRYVELDRFYEHKVVHYRNLFEFMFYFIFSLNGGMRLTDNQKLRKLVREKKVDLLFVDNSLIGRLSNWFFKNTKVVFFFHNIEYLYSKQQFAQKNFLVRTLMGIRSHQIYLNERRICRKAHGIVTLNKRDSDCLKELYGREADFIWPTTFDDNFSSCGTVSSDDDYMLFVGSNFFGNVDGLAWFIENCMPKCSLKLKVVGSGMDELASRFSCPNVEFVGYVPDLAQAYYEASFVVLPIISGSGMKTKTCEAFMYGKTVIGTTEAFEGYEGLDPSFAIVCNTADAFVKEIDRLSETQKGKVNEKSREYFLANYETSVYEGKLLDYIDSLG